MQWGTVIKAYSGYRNINKIGSGGFGNVYKYTDQTVVKEEFKVRYTYCINLLNSSCLSNH